MQAATGWFNSYVVSAGGVILRVWRRATPMADQLVGRRVNELLISPLAIIILRALIYLTIKNGTHHQMMARIKAPNGQILLRYLAISPLPPDSLVSARLPQRRHRAPPPYHH